MLMFGEGANSFMYSNANGIIYVGLMIVPQSIFNIYKAKKYWKSYRPKSVNYLLVEILMIVLTINFVVNSFWVNGTATNSRFSQLRILL